MLRLLQSGAGAAIWIRAESGEEGGELQIGNCKLQIEGAGDEASRNAMAIVKNGAQCGILWRGGFN